MSDWAYEAALKIEYPLDDESLENFPTETVAKAIRQARVDALKEAIKLCEDYRIDPLCVADIRALIPQKETKE
jgi:hypothetical protein